MAVFCVEVGPRSLECDEGRAAQLVALLRDAGVAGLTGAHASRLYFLEGELSRADAERIGGGLLADPVTNRATVLADGEPPPRVAAGQCAFEVHPRPGVMDPVAESALAELRAEGLAVETVRTARRYVVWGEISAEQVLERVGRVLANDCIEEIVPGTAGVRSSRKPPRFDFAVRHVVLRDLDDAALTKLSREAHLFLSLEEMRAIQAHFRELQREPTDLEIESLAQTWSEHCVHKTMRSAIMYRGLHMPRRTEADEEPPPACGAEMRHYDNLLKDTIARATEELMAEGRGPQCLSVFQDNAGIIAFDDEFGIAFKVETHNHPSAIEPYGGAATGIGGVIRDVIGCGLGAKPIANTDVFCVGPADWPQERLPAGVLHPWRVLRGVVSGVADYGNRMGIPTVNGAVCFDPRYLGNPLVFCGSVGLIPRGLVHKQSQPGDLVVVIGGRTGRDGIHGATFSSAELTDTHADEFSHAVQIGNAITEKRVLDAVLQARDAEGGCLYSAITDCGAGGLSSAVGEMAETIGAAVDLDQVPLKYAGLRYDEIWISEAQERMVVAVPRHNLDRLLAIMRAEEVEARVIGEFGAATAAGRPQLILRFEQQVVGELDMEFLHHGVPHIERIADWQPTPASWGHDPVHKEAVDVAAAVGKRLLAELRRSDIASREWIIRQYDHEVQGASVIKPLLGPGRGPGDAAVLRPRLSSSRGVAVGCGFAPHLADIDPYWMAAASIDEAIRNVVCVGGDPRQTALLDNFCWGRTDDQRQLGALARACQACYDVAKVYGTPFISGKDSLNNEFALEVGDVERLIETLRTRAATPTREAERLRAILPQLEQRLRATHRLVIPSTLLISALSLVDDVRCCVSPDLKQAGHTVLLVGGLPEIGFSLPAAAQTHAAVADLVRRGQLVACHDVSEGGWLVAVAEMALAGLRGLDLLPDGVAGLSPFEPCCAGYVVEVADIDVVERELHGLGVRFSVLGTVGTGTAVRCGPAAVDGHELRQAWSGTEARGPV